MRSVGWGGAACGFLFNDAFVQLSSVDRSLTVAKDEWTELGDVRIPTTGGSGGSTLLRVYVASRRPV